MCKVTVKINTVIANLYVHYTVIAGLLVAKKRRTLVGNHMEEGGPLQAEVQHSALCC